MRSGRTTKTSQRALRPLSPKINNTPTPVVEEASTPTSRSPDEAYLAYPLQQQELIQFAAGLEGGHSQESDPPTHPNQFEPDYFLPVFPYPTITQLRDFPNLSAPTLQRQSSVIVTRTQSAPPSPTLPIDIGNSPSPSLSPSDVSILLSNPGFRPLPANLAPNTSTPTPAGSWDNFLEEPTYKSETQKFWDTRKQAHIQIVSTDISELEDPFSDNSTVSSIGLLDCGRFDQQANSDSAQTIKSAAATMSEKEKAVEELNSLRLEAEDICDDLDPSLITTESAASMNSEIEKIEAARNNYRNKVRNFLKMFASELTTPEVNQWNADLKVLVNKVNSHKMTILAKVNQLMPPSVTMSEFERASIEIQKQQLALQQEVINNQKQEVTAAVKPMKKLILEKCTQLEEELAQVSVTNIKEGDDQQVTRTILKLADWKNQMESITTLNQELLTKTALFPMASEDQLEMTATIERVKSALTDTITTAEEEDLTRQLYSLDITARGDQIKWPLFAGDTGEDFFKFKKDFEHAARQNRTSTRNQLSKLKENIRGFAKSLIPPTVTDIKRAFDILEKAFGDSMKVVNHRLDNLMKVGPWPVEGSRDCYSKQVIRIVKVQGLLRLRKRHVQITKNNSGFRISTLFEAPRGR